ncbi:MAG: hypothetical protein HF312_13165 [Ignavibacteria bacterium]|jgi:glutathione synthase/RimK-type ligase-like ATP-grasp enzyme|nr:hypothetical protein [Ignavibacteria bacterium]MCU7521163.1 hypothetical protein [Ignavibacteria bacterium]
MKILVITNSYDVTVDYIINKYNSYYQIFRFNIDKFDEYRIRIANNPFNYLISSPVQEIKSEEIKSIYFRKPTFSKKQEDEIGLVKKSLLRLIYGFAESFDGTCLTRPSILSVSENKVVQMKVAEKVGLKIPKSLITNIRLDADQFSNTNRSTIFKFLCNSNYEKGNNEYTLGTNILDDSESLRGIEKLPIYFQEYQEKTYELRVTIIGETIYAVKILSQGHESTRIDWRKCYNALQYGMDELPKSVRDKLFLLMKELNIKFGAFDLIFHNGEYYFLEVNPNGQWLWLERSLGIDISEQIIKYLIK